MHLIPSPACLRTSLLVRIFSGTQERPLLVRLFFKLKFSFIFNIQQQFNDRYSVHSTTKIKKICMTNNSTKVHNTYPTNQVNQCPSWFPWRTLMFLCIMPTYFAAFADMMLVSVDALFATMFTFSLSSAILSFSSSTFFDCIFMNSLNLSSFFSSIFALGVYLLDMIVLACEGWGTWWGFERGPCGDEVSAPTQRIVQTSTIFPFIWH